MRHIYARSVLAVLSGVCVLALPLTSYAQFTLPNTENAIFISMLPEHPGPRSVVKLTVSSAIIDLANSTITWQVNGKGLASGTGLVTASVTVGPLGADTNVSVSANNEDTNASGQIDIVPTAVDLLWEADTYTPPFYGGRALPSAGSKLRLQALPWFRRADGTLIPTSDIVFTWKRDGQVLGSVSGRGHSSVVIDSPQLMGSNTISVSAVAADNSLSGSASTRIDSTEPIITLYKDHPLFGIQFNDALSNAISIPDTQMTFAAIPYFAPAPTLGDADLIYDWQVNGTKVDADRAKPNEITINGAGTSNTAAVSLDLTHQTNFFLSSSARWTISLSTAAVGKGGNPSGPTIFDPQGQ